MRRRTAFTIVELLVAMALILLIMVILSEAFAMTAQAFRHVKAMGDMAERMRSASFVLRRDLAADHFEGKKRLSQPDFWNNGPPLNGFFRIYQGSQGNWEGNDLDSLASYRSTDHMLHFTVKLRGNFRSDCLFADIPLANSPLANFGQPNVTIPYQDSNSIFTSQWAEVAWFLRQTGDNADGTPLYALYRRQRLAVPDPNPATWTKASDAAQAAQYPLVSQVSGVFNSPVDLTVPQRRFGMASGVGNEAGVLTGGVYPTLAEDFSSGATTIDLSGADLILTDVISFDVRILIYDTKGNLEDDFTDLFNSSSGKLGTGNSAITQYGNNNTTYSPQQAPCIFDTWTQLIDNQVDFSSWATGGTTKSIPLYQASNGAKIQIKAIQVIIRCWDYKTLQTRQITVIQDL